MPHHNPEQRRDQQGVVGLQLATQIQIRLCLASTTCRYIVCLCSLPKAPCIAIQ